MGGFLLSERNAFHLKKTFLLFFLLGKIIKNNEGYFMLHLEDYLETQYAQVHHPHGPGLSWNRIGRISNSERVLCAILVGERIYYRGQKLSVTSYMKILAYQGMKCHGVGCQSHTPIMTLENTQGGSVKIRAFVHNHGREVLITRDHDLARSLGGTNDISNITPLCRECNNTKSAIETHLSNIQKNYKDIKGGATVNAIVSMIEQLLHGLDEVAHKNKMCPSNIILHFNNTSVESNAERSQEQNWLFESIGRHWGFSENAFDCFLNEAKKASDAIKGQFYEVEGSTFNLSVRLHKINQQRVKKNQAEGSNVIIENKTAGTKKKSHNLQGKRKIIANRR